MTPGCHAQLVGGGNVVNEKQHRGRHPWKVLLEIVVYLAAILALAYQPDDEVTLFSNCLDGEGNDKDCRFFFA